MLEQGAIALAVGRLADGDADEWGRIGRLRLLDGLLAGRFAGAGGAAARLEAAGLPLSGAGSTESSCRVRRCQPRRWPQQRDRFGDGR